MIKPLFQKVIVAYNGSKSSLHAVMYAILLAKQTSCRVKVIYVVNTDAIKTLSLAKVLIPDEVKDASVDLEQDGKNNLAYVEKLGKSKGVKIETELRFGAVWSELVRSADEWQANLILLGGTSGLTEFTNLIHTKLSNQNSEIIGSSHCNVMVVKEQYIEQLFKMA